MSEAPRTHREQSKKKIGSSQKRLWAKRLKLKRSKEKFYYSWAESIAEAAKKGGIGEEQLCWDSYEIQKNEIACRQHQQNEEKAREMLIQRIQAAREQRRAQNMASLAENKLDHRQQKGEPRTKQKGRSCKTRNTNKETVTSEGSLKSRLAKMDPGPRFQSILNLQRSHRSDAIWDGEEYGVLTLRHHLRAFSSFPVPEAVINYLDNTQFRGLTRLCKVPLDPDLITALVERWREETHTFHLPFGEVTITLQDVAMLFGLRISGKPVTGTSDWNWRQLCANLLGAIPSTISLKGSALKLVWLHDNFQNLPENAGEYQLHCYVRAYLLYLIGAVLFPDKSGNTVSLLFLPLLEDLTQLDEISWGSGVLACLYRNLCKATKKDVWQIAGPLLLLQFWSWERVSIGRPDIIRSTVPIVEGVAYPLGSQIRVGLDPLACKWLRVNRTYKDHRLGLVVIRDLLDKMVEMQFVWQPYTPNIVQHLSPTCVQDHEEWTVIAPLICFEMVEFHFPHRCMRQFGWHQVIPPLCNTCENLHAITRQGDSQTDYAALHKTQIAQWDNRLDKIMETGEPYCGLMRDDDPYLLWYRDITRLIVTPLSQNVNVDYDNYHYYYPTAADFQKLTQAHVLNYNTSEEMISNMSDDVPLAQYNMAERMRLLSLDALRSTRQGHLVNYEEAKSPSPSPPRYDFRRLEHRQTYTSQDSQEAEPSQRNRKKGKSRK